MSAKNRHAVTPRAVDEAANCRCVLVMPNRATTRDVAFEMVEQLSLAGIETAVFLDHCASVLRGRIADKKSIQPSAWIVRADFGPEMSSLSEMKQVTLEAHKSLKKLMREYETRMRSMATAENRSRKADERRQVAADMRRSGMTYVEIGKRIGVSAKRARDLAAGARDE